MSISSLLMGQRRAAYEFNSSNILRCIEKNSDAGLLDMGCYDGKWTVKVAEKMGTKKIFGLEIIDEKAREAERSGVKVKLGDLNDKLPFEQEFDVIHSNQVIEHLKDTDLFISEIHRLLKPGGYTIISTENLASWHNVFSLVLGFTPFSLVNCTSKTAAVGNPLAPQEGNDLQFEYLQHHKVFTLRGLKELLVLFGFRIEKVLGAGYYPFGNLFCGIDPNHSAFVTIKARKVK
ncbi:MAG: class I SAM-dependent methyltransferase [Candidatus Delongbacteria bacterium]